MQGATSSTDYSPSSLWVDNSPGVLFVRRSLDGRSLTCPPLAGAKFRVKERQTLCPARHYTIAPYLENTYTLVNPWPSGHYLHNSSIGAPITFGYGYNVAVTSGPYLTAAEDRSYL